MLLENAFQGVTLNHGMEFGLVLHKRIRSNVFGYVSNDTNRKQYVS